MLDRFRRSNRDRDTDRGSPSLLRSFGTWETLDESSRRVVQICHPDWRGVRTATYAFGAPVIESSDLSPVADVLAAELVDHGVETVVLHAWPPGAARFLEAASTAGLSTRVVFHSSMAQHGTDAGEGEAVAEALALSTAGVVGRVGFVKEGLAEAFRSFGYDAAYLPNRVPDLPPYETAPVGDGLEVGILLDPYWRKNVTTQLGAVRILGGRAHVSRLPDVGYIRSMAAVEHGDLDRAAYLGLQASMTINFNVTLSECHPMAPMESFLSGVPCLVSATSALFAEDPDLYDLVTVAEADNPKTIADKAVLLLEDREEAVDRARAWMAEHDLRAGERFARFTSGDASGAP